MRSSTARTSSTGTVAVRAAALVLALGFAAGAAAAQEPDGGQLYAQHCAACHMPTGEGMEPTFPALAGNEFLLGDPHGPIGVVLHGRGAMPAFGGQLSDDEIAAVISHERTSWGNEAGPVDAQAVAEVREEPEADAPEEEPEADAPEEEPEADAPEEEPVPDEPDPEDPDPDVADPEADDPEVAEPDAEPVVLDLPEDWFEQGREAYTANCAACHQADGAGVAGAFPPLAGNPFVTAHPQGILHVVLNGRAGMPAFGGLSDERIALIVSYVRNAWENDAHGVDADMVGTVRDGDELDFERVEPLDRPGAGQ
jgi:cytochrome c oxidase subunit II